MPKLSEEEKKELLQRGVGVSQVRRKRLNDRIVADNLRCLLITLGWIVNYDFDVVDWDVVSKELRGTDLQTKTWFEYDLVGTHSARIKLARDGEDFVAIQVDVAVELLAQVRLAIEIFGAFAVSVPSNPQLRP